MNTVRLSWVRLIGYDSGEKAKFSSRDNRDSDQRSVGRGEFVPRKIEDDKELDCTRDSPWIRDE